MDKIAVIVAGGTGTRMKSEIPKQFMMLANLPLLMHTIKKFWNYDNSIKIIVVLPEDQIKYWKKLCKNYRFTTRHEIRKGGETRYHSVKNGLRGIKPGYLVAIHDGVRPLVSKQVIKRCYAGAEKYGAAIPVIDVAETVRIVKGKENENIHRNNLKIVQTPQVFQSSILIKAFKKAVDSLVTDDATVVEADGNKIHLVEGNIENIKITTKHDMVVAEAIYHDTYR